MEVRECWKEHLYGNKLENRIQTKVSNVQENKLDEKDVLTVVRRLGNSMRPGRNGVSEKC